MKAAFGGEVNMPTNTITRRVRADRFQRVLDDIKKSNSRGFQAHVAKAVGDVTPQAVYSVLNGSTSKRIGKAIVKLWPIWKKAAQRAA